MTSMIEVNGCDASIGEAIIVWGAIFLFCFLVYVALKILGINLF